MVAINLLMTLKAARRGATGAHRHKVERNVARDYAVDENQAQQALKIGCHRICGIEIRTIRIALKALNGIAIQAKTLIRAAAAIKTWMRRHKAQTHHRATEATAAKIGRASCRERV